MGGQGSGRFTNAEDKKAASEAAKANRTQETQEFINTLDKQRGDRLFEVVRVYGSGDKPSLGTINNSQDKNLGLKFGGGVYELYELDRATETRTGRVIKKNLHPSAYPFRKQFALDTHEIEALEVDGARTGAATVTNLAGLTPEQIFEKARDQARREMEEVARQKKIEETIMQLADQVKKLTENPTAAPTSMRDEMAGWFEFFKKVSPAPQPQPNFVAPDPAAQLQQTVELFKSMKTVFGELGADASKGKITPMTEKLISSLSDLAGRGINAWERSQKAKEAAAGKVFDERQAGNAQRPPGTSQGSAAPAGGGTATVTETAPRTFAPGYKPTAADFPTIQEFEQYQEDTMTFDLIKLVEYDMAGQLAGKPGFSMFRTADAIRARWTDSKADAAWLKLRDGIKSYSTEQLVNHFAGLQPELFTPGRPCDYLGALIDILKQREGAAP